MAKLLDWASRKIPQAGEGPALLSQGTLEAEYDFDLRAPPPLPPALPEEPTPYSPPESGERLQTVRPQAVPNGTPLAELIAQVVGECRTHVLDRIRKANDMTSTEVIAVGNSLDQIVSRAQNQVKATRATLDGLSGVSKRGVTELVEQQARIAATRFSAIRGALQEQTVLTRQAMQASSEIAKIGAGVARVAFQARLLSLNANIEAARFGDQGGGFQVIATEMRRLTDEIDRANRQIESIASNLLGSLPKISERADELCRHADGFTEELTENSAAVESATSKLKKSVNELLANGDQTATQVLAGSHAALSHLQFQDPTAQSLLIIDADLAQLAEQLATLLKHAGAEAALVPDGVELDMRAADAHRALNAGTVAVLDQHSDVQEAGEVLLF